MQSKNEKNKTKGRNLKKKVNLNKIDQSTLTEKKKKSYLGVTLAFLPEGYAKFTQCSSREMPLHNWLRRDGKPFLYSVLS